MQQTTNYGFKKRELTDLPDITQTEDNWDVVDTQMKQNADAAAAAGVTAVAAQQNIESHKADTANPHQVTAAQAGAAPESHVGAGGSEHPAATTAVAGFMSATDKSKLNGIEAGATGDQTAAEILAAIKTVDGSGSGLDADLLDAKNAGNASGNIPVSNGTKCTNLNADKVDGIDFQIVNGQLQYYDGGWKDVGVVVTQPRVAAVTIDNPTLNTWYTVLNIASGSGVLNRVAGIHSAQTSDKFDFRITVDGVASTVDHNIADIITGFSDNSRRMDIVPRVKFNSSLKVEIRATIEGSFSLDAFADYALT